MDKAICSKVFLNNGSTIVCSGHRILELTQVAGAPGVILHDYPIISYDKDTGNPTYDKTERKPIMFYPMSQINHVVFEIKR